MAAVSRSVRLSRWCAALALGAALSVTGCHHSDLAPSTLSLDTYSAPFRLSQVDGSGGMKVWPYGVSGGDHPNGHPGIDFFLAVGADVLADANGTVSDVSSSMYPGEKSIAVSHGDGWRSYFTGYFQDIVVVRGTSVSAGQLLGHAAPFGGGAGAASYHWGVVEDTRAGNPRCPADFLRPADRQVVQRMLDESNYPEKERFPLLCNPCGAGGCR